MVVGIDLFKTLGLSILGLLYVVPVLGTAAEAPHVGEGASIHVTIGGSGVVNAGVGVAGYANSKQMIGSLISGNVGGKLNLSTQIKNTGVVNVGASVAASTTATQAIDTVKLSGTASGNVTDQVTLTGTAVTNVAVGVAADAKACQLIGTIGLNCD